MKWLIIGVVIIIGVAYFFIRYKHSVSIRHKPLDNKTMKFNFKFHETDTLIQMITLLTTTIWISIGNIDCLI